MIRHRPASESPLNKPTITLPAIAIDVGFFSTKYTLGRREGKAADITVRQFPSVAPRVTGHMQKFPGLDKLDGIVIEVEPGLRHFVGQDAYYMASTSGTRAVTPDFCLTSDYKAFFLGALFHIARELGASNALHIDTLVAGLPLSTVYTHSSTLQAFLKGAHRIPDPSAAENADATMTVTVKNAMVIAQPQGALITHGFGAAANSRADLNTLVLDMGGGTFDWFVAKGVKPNRALCGAVSIGALACATAICNEINPELKDNPEIMARVDKALRDNSDTVLISGVKHDMARFRPVVQRVLQDAIEQMRKSVGSLNAIDHILVTGGGGHLIYEALKETLPQYQHLLEMDRDPVSSNVRGFHALAEFQSHRR